MSSVNKRDVFNIFFRYFIIIIVGLFGVKLIYTIFTPLTVYPVYWILKIFYPSIVLDKITIFLEGYSIKLVEACIAGAAYYLLLILNLATPMHFINRLKTLKFTFLTFLLLNIIRIVVFVVIFISGYDYFDLAHKAVWYFGSTILVVVIWFFSISLFKIKAIPAYTDFKSMLSYSKQIRK